MDFPSRFDGVDVLRGFSILAVILLHTFIRFHSVGVSLDQLLPDRLFHFLFRNGNHGVTVFFAISGFLITYTSLLRFGSLRSINPIHFYRIRFARIAPLLLLILTLLSVLHLLHTPGFEIPSEKATLPRALLAALTFHLNWLEAVRGYLPANWDVLWSLSVEEMFYLFFPIVCSTVLRLTGGRKLLLTILVAFVVAGPFARSVWTDNPIWQDKSYLGGMDSIALGCLTALFIHTLVRNGAKPPTYVFELLGAALLFLIALWPRWPLMAFLGRHGLDDSLLALGTCLIITGSVTRGTRGGFLTAPLRWFGRHSYEVYLTHEFIVIWMMTLYGTISRPRIALWIAAIVLLCAPIGFLVARCFSEPLNRRLRPPSRVHATLEQPVPAVV